MSISVDEQARLTAESRALGEQMGDPAWLAHLRRRAAGLAASLLWPDSHELRPWKYYDASGIDFAAYPVSEDESIAVEAGEGLTAVPFAFAEGAAASAVERYLGSAVGPGKDRFAALHYAFLRDGIVVHVPDGHEAAEPVRIVRTLTGSQFATPHTLVVTGANSRVTIIEEYVSDGEDILAVPVVEVVPGPDSEVRHYTIHRWGPQTRVFLYQRMAGDAPGGAFQSLHLVLGGRVVKGQLESSLAGRGSSSELLGLAYGVGEEYVDFATIQDHIGPDTRSDLNFKAALKDHSRAVYYGLTRVGLEARNADANQENRNLLLSKTARADSDPVLEILTSNIVRASHGATAGPVDQEQLFYLQARGIPLAEAEALLVRAFLGSVTARVHDEGVRARLEEALDSKLA